MNRYLETYLQNINIRWIILHFNNGCSHHQRLLKSITLNVLRGTKKIELDRMSRNKLTMAIVKIKPR